MTLGTCEINGREGKLIFISPQMIRSSNDIFSQIYQDVKLIVKHCLEFSGVKDHKENGIRMGN